MHVLIILAGLTLALAPVAQGEKSLTKDDILSSIKNNQGVQYERLND